MKEFCFLMLLLVSLNTAPVYTKDSLKSRELLTLSLEQLLQIKVSSASRREESILDIPSTIYVITSNQIALHGFRDLKDILKFIPGVEYSYPHSWLQGGQRGFSDNWSKTKIMIDGTELNLLYSGEAFIGHQFMAENIERVEVIHGPGSAIYGADAYAGIINIVTKGDNKSKTEIRVRKEYGSDEYSGEQFSFFSAGTSRDLEYRIFLGSLSIDDVNFQDFVQTEEFSEPQPNLDVRRQLLVSGDEPYRDENEATQFHFELKWHLEPEHKIEFKSIYLEDKDGGGLESPEISFKNFRTVRDQRLFKINYQFSPQDSGLGFKAKLEHHNSDELNDLNFREVVNGGLSELYVFDIVDSKEDIFELQFDYRALTSAFYFIGGVGHRKKYLPVPDFRLKNTPFTEVTDFQSLLPFTEQEIDYVFIQLQNKYLDDKLGLVAGLRLDEHNIYDAPITRRVGVTYQLPDNYVAKLNYGESFRSPTMFELETNPLLGPANLDSYELSISSSDSNWSWKASFYKTEAKDLIVTLFDSSQSENFTTVNEGQVSIKGFEFNSNHQWESYNLNWWVSSTDSSEAENISKWQAGALFSYELNDAQSLSLAARYFGDVSTVYLDAAFEPNDLSLNGFNTLDFNWLVQNAFEIDGLDLSVGVRNLLNEKAIFPNVRGNDPKGFLLQGLNSSVQFKYRFD